MVGSFSCNNRYTDSRRLLLGWALMGLSVAALSAWIFMPIYPDEIAFRLQLGRYISGDGVVSGFDALYPLCRADLKEIPFLFEIAARLLTFFDFYLSPVLFRILPFVAVVAAVFTVIRYSSRGVNPCAAAVATCAFLGVSGSGLIIARYEFLQILNVACCFFVFIHLERRQEIGWFSRVLLIFLLFSTLLSTYAHVQGVLFLPVVLLLCYRLLRRNYGGVWAGLVVTLLLVAIAGTTIRFHQNTCSGYPQFAVFWGRMTVGFNDIAFHGLPAWLCAKFDRYLVSFEYSDGYAINYLPGVIFSSRWASLFVTVVNFAIRVILITNLFLVAVLLVLITAGIAKRFLSAGSSDDDEAFGRLSFDQQIFVLSLSCPVFFLLLYDAVQNFYRTFFLNALISLVLSFVMSRVHAKRFSKVLKFYSVACGAMVCVSLCVNFWWFSGRLRSGFEGPSISLSQNWSKISADVESLVNECGMDVAKGGIVLDDLTYNSLKSYPNLYAATYLGLAAEITGLSMTDVIRRVKPNYAIARCDTLSGLHIGFQSSRNELCCGSF